MPFGPQGKGHSRHHTSLTTTGCGLHTGINTTAASTQMPGKGKGQAWVRHQIIKILLSKEKNTIRTV